MPDSASFCPKCGIKQPQARDYGRSEIALSHKKTARDIYDDAVVLVKDKIENSEIISDAVKNVNANAGILQKAAFIGTALVASSVFMPMIKIVGLIEFGLMDYGKILGLFCLALCGLMFVSIAQKKYAFPILAAHSMLIFFFIMYSHYSSEMQKSFWGSIARITVTTGAGVYFFVFGLLIVIGASLLCTVMENSGIISATGIIGQYVKYIIKPVKILGIPLPGFVWIAALTILIIFMTSFSNPLRDLQDGMNGYNRRLFGR